MSEMIPMQIIAHIHNDFKEKFGIPRQSGRVNSMESRIVFTSEYRSADALRGIDGFSHLWLIFDFSLAHRKTWSPTVRPPRLGGNRRIGVFATRSPFRPNPIGLSSVRLVRVEHTKEDGDVLVVSGADLLDGTPILDIKPYLPRYDAHPDACGSYADETAEYRLSVEFPKDLLLLIPEEKRAAILDCLADDPRPSYQDDPERVYSMRFADYDVRFRVSDDTVWVVAVDQV